MARDKEKRRIRDQARRDAGTLKGWGRARRYMTPEGHRRCMLNAARARAKRKGLEFDLELSDISIPTHCPALGIELAVRFGKSGACDTSPTLDRRDNSKGYVKGNVVVVSWRANRIKCDATPDELRKVAKYYGKKTGKQASTKDTR